MLTTCLLSAILLAPPVTARDFRRTVYVEDRVRSYLVHIPASYDPEVPTPVVLALHGAGVNAALTVPITGLNAKSDRSGFIVVYPNGTGVGPFLRWNAGGVLGELGENQPDDVLFLRAVLDDLATRVNVDSRRVFATGLSNGGMMCYRLAAEMSDRIAAIAPIAGPQATDFVLPSRAVSIMHFHGTVDPVVPPTGPAPGTPSFLTFKTVDETLQIWVTHNECSAKPEMTELPNLVPDTTSVETSVYGLGRDASEVIYVRILNGGHSWPGKNSFLSLFGPITFDIQANDLMWDFFERHPMP